MKLSVCAVLLYLGYWTLTPPVLGAPRGPSLTHLQKQMLVTAYNIGGYRLSAIIFQESSACIHVHSPIDKRACGCGGTHTDTAGYVANSRVSCRMLDTDWDFSIRIANAYLQQCTLLYGEKGGVSCYHWGLPASYRMTTKQLDTSDYLHTIERRIRELQALPLDTQ